MLVPGGFSSNQILQISGKILRLRIFRLGVFYVAPNLATAALFFVMWMWPSFLGTGALDDCLVILAMEAAAIAAPIVFVVAMVLVGAGKTKFEMSDMPVIILFLPVIAVVCIAVVVPVVLFVYIAVPHILPLLFFTWHIGAFFLALKTANDESGALVVRRYVLTTVIFGSTLFIAMWAAAFFRVPSFGWEFQQEGIHNLFLWGVLYFLSLAALDMFWPRIRRSIAASHLQVSEQGSAAKSIVDVMDDVV